MEKINNSYESMLIVSLANGEEAAKATVSKFTGLIAANAELVQVDEWGKRRMAYPIQDMNDGYYTVATFKCEGNFPAELQRLMNIDESVLRVMVIKLDYEAVAKATEAEPVVEAPAEEPAAVEEAPVAEAPAQDAE